MKEQPTPQSVEHEATTVFSTDNGMEVLIREDHFAPVVAMQVWVKAGSTDESDAEAGVAHVHEHMLFKGTARRGVGEIAGEVESAGGRINAWTSWDQTVYHIVLASRYAEQGLDILADAVQHSSFDPNELNKELGVVMEEYKRGQDMPGTRLFHTLFATAFEKHPYRRPVIGTEQSITHLTREKVLDFFSRFYAPNNMALIIVGDVDTERVKAQIHEEFDGFESRKIEKPVRPSEDPQDELRYESLRMDVKESHLAVAFHIPDANHDDAPLLDMVSFVLGGGEGSRLYRRLVAEAELANSVSAFAYTPVDPGLFVITASLEDEKLLGTLEGILDETAELRARPLTAEELKRARHNLKADFIYRRQTVQGQAREIGYLLTVHNDLEYDRRYLQRLDAITLEEVQQAALRYFDRNNLTVVSLLPNDSPSQLSRTDVEAAATALDAGREASASKSEERAARAEKTARPPVARTGSGPAELVTLDNGVRIVVQEHHDAPLFSVRVGMIGGLLAETPDNNGVSSFVAEMLTRGTARYSREELSTRIESLASDLSGFSGRNSLGISGSFLTAHFEESLELLLEVLLNPSFDEKELEKTRRELLLAIANREDESSHRAFELAYKTVFPDHPYGMAVQGELDSVSSLDRDDLMAFYRSALDPRRLVVSVVGDVDSRSVVKMLSDALSALAPEKGGFALPSPAAVPTGPRHERKESARHQSHIVVAWQGVDIKNPDRYPLSVLETILSRQGGRLFYELRDRKGLAYSVTAFSNEGLAPGLFGAYIATDPDNEDRAVKGLLAEFEKVRSAQVSDDELARAKRYLLGSHEIGLQTNAAMCTEMLFNELYGLGFLYGQRYADLISSVTVEDVQRVARKYLAESTWSQVVVGPPQEN